MDSSQQVALITGATSGIGAATARRFALGGMRVIALGRRPERLQELADELGTRCLPLAVDVTDDEIVRAAIANLPADFANIDVLVNNAGTAVGNTAVDVAQLSNWRRMVDTNIQGLLSVTHAVTPRMIARRRGHIINIGSITARYPSPGGGVYGATKAFVRQLTLNMRADLAPFDIRCTCIEPGTTKTEFARTRLEGDAAAADAFYDHVGILAPEDVAGIVWYAASLPPHININLLEVMPTRQTFSFFTFIDD